MKLRFRTGDESADIDQNGTAVSVDIRRRRRGVRGGNELTANSMGCVDDAGAATGGTDATEVFQSVRFETKGMRRPRSASARGDGGGAAM
jgi:hypothetical protein